MADLCIVCTDDSRPNHLYQDGDIAMVFTDRAIKHDNAFAICNPRLVPPNADGLRVSVLAQGYCELVYQYRFEHISLYEVRRTEIATGQSTVLSNVPVDGEYFRNADSWIKSQKRRGVRAFFGTLGNEVWYGGHMNWSDSTVSTVWAHIEANSAHLESDHTTKDVGSETAKRLLVLPAQPVRDVIAQRANRVEVDYDDAQPEFNPDQGVGNNIARKRRVSLDWRNAGLPLSVADILNPTINSDLRGTIPPVGMDNVIVKPRVNFWSERGHLVTDPTLFVPVA